MPDPGPYEVELLRRAGTLRVVLRGDVDLSARPELERILWELDPASLERVVIDLREVTFFDSTGLTMAYRFDRWGRQYDVPVLFTRAAPDIMLGLIAAGLSHTLTFSAAPEDRFTPPG